MVTIERAVNEIKHGIVAATWKQEEYVDGIRRDALEAMVAEVERKSSKWVVKEHDNLHVDVVCACCGAVRIQTYGFTVEQVKGMGTNIPYCEQCGARMEVDE